MKKAIAMLLATVMCTAMLTGCGSDSAANESSQASESSVAETAAATTTTEAAATTEAADKTEGMPTACSRCPRRHRTGAAYWRC